MLLRCLVVATLALALIVPAEAACCAGFGGCPAAATDSTHCCEAAVDNPAAKRCCDGAASSELLFTGAKTHDSRIVATPAVVPIAGQLFRADTNVSWEGRVSEPPFFFEPLYTLHSILLI